MKFIFLIYGLIVACLAPVAFGSELDDSSKSVTATPKKNASGISSKNIQTTIQSKPKPVRPFNPPIFTLHATTEFPIWVGAEAELIVSKKLSFDVGYGTMPQFYAGILGSVAGALAQNGGYKELVTSLMQKNAAFRVEGDYRFSGDEGWLIGSTFYFFKATGEEPIVDVMEAMTGQDYTPLKNLLAAAGRNPVVFSDASLIIGEVHGGYSFALGNHFYLRTTAGIALIISADLSVSSSSPAFDKSVLGQRLYSNSISNIKNILSSYGISPTVEASFIYSFD